jgi:hypothetical protein
MLLNTLEERLCTEGIERRIFEDSVELCQEGIEQVQGEHRTTTFCNVGDIEEKPESLNTLREASSASVH